MPLIPLQIVGDSSIFNREIEVSVLAKQLGLVPAANPATVGVTAPYIASLQQTVAASEFTDGGADVGTLTLTAQLPALSYVLFTSLVVPAGFAGDTQCFFRAGTVADTDRFLDTDPADPNIFDTAASGLDVGDPSGVRVCTEATDVLLTITSAADISLVIAEAGVLRIAINYIQAG